MFSGGGSQALPFAEEQQQVLRQAQEADDFALAQAQQAAQEAEDLALAQAQQAAASAADQASAVSQAAVVKQAELAEQQAQAEAQARNAEEANAEHAGGPDYSATPQPTRPPPRVAEASLAPPVVEISPTQPHVHREKRKVESPSQLPAIDEDVVPPKTAALKSDGPVRQTRSGSSALQPGFLDFPSGRATGLNGLRASRVSEKSKPTDTSGMFSDALKDLFGGPGEAADPMNVASQREQGRDFDISEDDTGVCDITMEAGDSAEQQQAPPVGTDAQTPVPELPGSSLEAMEPGSLC